MRASLFRSRLVSTQGVRSWRGLLVPRPVVTAFIAGAAGVTFGFITVAFADAGGSKANAVNITDLPPSAAPSQHLPLNELNKKKAWFQSNYPNGLPLEEFTKLMKLSDPTYAALMFNAIDTDHNGVIDVNEYLIYASIATAGTPEEKMRFQFSLYDLNHDGYISFSELVQIVKILIKTGYIPAAALREHDFWQAGKRSAEDLAAQLMKDADTNRDARISWEEFAGLILEIEAIRLSSSQSMMEKEKKIQEMQVKMKPLPKM